MANDPAICRRAALFAAIEGANAYTRVCPDDTALWEQIGVIAAVANGAVAPSALATVRVRVGARIDKLVAAATDIGGERGILSVAIVGLRAVLAAADDDACTGERTARAAAGEAHRTIERTLASTPVDPRT